MAKYIKFSNRVNDPPFLLMWSADELAPTLLGLVLGIMIEKAAICCALGYGCTTIYRKFRDSKPDGYFLHLLYRYGFNMNSAKTMINPFTKRLIP